VTNADRIRQRGKTQARARRAGGRPDRDDYGWLSTRPLHALVFLLPMIVLYELGSLYYLLDNSTGVRTTVRAENLLRVFFESFGVLWIMLPGITVIAVLLAWHVVSRDRLRVRPMVVAGMHLEAALWAVPLLVLAAILQHARAGGLCVTDVLPAAAPASNGSLMDMPWPARATISLGAGIYEELVFRLAGLSMLHLLFKDVIGVRDAWAKGLAVAITALAFAFYHDRQVLYSGVDLGQWFGMLFTLNLTDFFAAVRWGAVLFYTIAGAFFALIFLYRGFGIVVGTHAAYDLAVLVLLAK